MMKNSKFFFFIYKIDVIHQFKTQVTTFQYLNKFQKVCIWYKNGFSYNIHIKIYRNFYGKDVDSLLFNWEFSN